MKKDNLKKAKKKQSSVIVVLSFILFFLLFLVLIIWGLLFAYKYMSKYSNGTVNDEIVRSNFEELQKLKDTKIGDNSKVNKIIDLLEFSMYKKSIKLQTEKEPYELNIYYDYESLSNNKLSANSYILFTLIPNVDIINFHDNQNINTFERSGFGKDFKFDLDKIENFKNSESFKAKVISLSNGSIEVAPEKESNVSKSSDKITFKTSLEFEVGDEIFIIYTGIIRETYPAQIDVIYIQKSI